VPGPSPPAAPSILRAANWWDSRAQTWERSFHTIATQMPAPGGNPWEGQAAQAAAARAAADHAQAAQAAAQLCSAAAVARQGAAQVAAAKAAALQAIDAATTDLFTVGEDLSVTDTLRSLGLLALLQRQRLADAHAAAIGAAATALVDIDTAVAGELQAATAGLPGIGVGNPLAAADGAGATNTAPGDPQKGTSGAGSAEPQHDSSAPTDTPLDAGARERPGVTDVNDPGVSWQPGFDPGQWKNSWQNPLLTDNPPGYTGGPGPERDAAWQSYLSNYPTGERGVLPKPDAVQDRGLKVLGSGATQLGTSYAWGGKGLRGPGPGTLEHDSGGGARTYADDQRIGFDCSGLTEYSVWQAAGTDIGAGTWHQVNSPNLSAVESTADLRPGDLIYYGAGGADHVGIFVSPGVILNAPQSGLPVQVEQRTTSLGSAPVIRGFRVPVG
jgi:cell wall-associated NlpC family hydrolase